MVCPRCAFPAAGPSCPRCGLDAAAFARTYAYACLRCGNSYVGWICPSCGTPAGQAPPGSGIRAVGSVVWSIAIVLFLLLLAATLVALAYASWIVVEGALASGPRPIFLFVPLPYPIGPVVDADAPAFLAYFGLVVAAIVAAYVYYARRDGARLVAAFRRPLVQLGWRLESRSAWVATGQVFLAVLFFQTAFIVFLQLSGFDPGTPDSAGLPEWYTFFALANASVYEEVVTRFLFVGVPLFLVALGLRDRPWAVGHDRPAAWRHLVGGTIHRDVPVPYLAAAGALTVASAAIFALAHVPSWGLWKFPPTFVAGIGLAYLFLRHGILAAVLMHFATDYLAAIALLSAGSIAGLLLVGLFVLLLVGSGFALFLWYVVYAARVSRHVLSGQPRPAPEAPPPPVVAYAPPPPVLYGGPPPPFAPAPPPTAGVPAPPPFGSPAPARAPASPPPYGTGFLPYACGRCGWQEARYAAGRLTCLRCGSEGP